MTINDIKKNALALMFTNYENDLVDINVDELSDDEYTRYTVNMNACINRALARIQNAEVLPYKRAEIDTQTPHTTNGIFSRYNIDDISSDIWDIKRIACESRYDYVTNVDYFIEARTIVIATLERGEKYVCIYTPKVKMIAMSALSDTELNIPDEVAEIIPYFIKAELYEEDEPALATQARNIFEATLDSLKQHEQYNQSSVKNVFRGLI